MMTRTLALVCAGACACVGYLLSPVLVQRALDLTVARAQAKPDFSGTWVLERVEVPERRTPPMGGGMGGRPGGMGMGGRPAGRGGIGGDTPVGRPAGTPPGVSGIGALEPGETVTIIQTAERLTVTPANAVPVSYPLDGQPVTRETSQGGKETVRTRWDGSALVTDTERKMETPRGSVDVKTRETRVLSTDGRMLTIRLTTGMGRGSISRTLVFRKREPSGRWRDGGAEVHVSLRPSSASSAPVAA